MQILVIMKDNLLDNFSISQIYSFTLFTIINNESNEVWLISAW